MLVNVCGSVVINPESHNPFGVATAPTPDPVTVIESRGEAAIYPEINEADYKPPGMYRTTFPPYDSMSEFEDDDAHEEEDCPERITGSDSMLIRRQSL